MLTTTTLEALHLQQANPAINQSSCQHTYVDYVAHFLTVPDQHLFQMDILRILCIFSVSTSTVHWYLPGQLEP
jgi:hypothetical protein